MAKNYFNRYLWLVELIERSGHIRLEEIKRAWRRSSLNETGEELAERTFHNHKEAILESFGIEIGYDRTLGYHIVDNSDLEGESLKK